MLSYEQINEIERSLGPQAHPVISALQALDKRIDEQRLEVKRDLLVELATNADIEGLRGEIKGISLSTKADIGGLRGELKADIQELRGEIKRLEVFMKVLIGLAVIGMTFFSPVAAELIRILK